MKILAFLFLLLSLNLFSQSKYDNAQITKTTHQIINEIQSINILMSGSIGYAGKRPKQYDNFTRLKGTATIDELINLTNHPNPTVRCYAFWALAYNPKINLFPIILDHINDDEMVETQFGCIGGDEPVGDFFISVVTPNQIDLNPNKLDSTQISTLDSILIYSSNNLWAKSAAINRAEPNESLYPIIRKLVVINNNQNALVTLAKYKNETDIELIKKNNNLFYTYKAISQFPHPIFFPILRKSLQETLNKKHYSGEWRELYKSIASFKNQDAIALLEVPFTEVKHKHIRKYHINYIFKALRTIEDPIYDDLLWKLWKEEDRINLEVFKYLSIKNPEKALMLTKENLKNINNLYMANISMSFDGYGNTEDLISEMNQLAIKEDLDFGLNNIRQNIKEAHVHLFPIYADEVIKIKDSSFIHPLFNRLEIETNPHIYLKIVEALISYSDDNINQRILAVRKSNKSLTKGWGAQSLVKILLSSNIK
jgi:hypothetical protein